MSRADPRFGLRLCGSAAHCEERNFLVKLALAVGGAYLLIGLAFVRADEGMCLGSSAIRPDKLLKEKYQFDLTDRWLGHAQKASIRFNNRGSGSFVSADGTRSSPTFTWPCTVSPKQN